MQQAWEKSQQLYNSLFISVFHQEKNINEKKDRVMVMHIENITKPLYRVFQMTVITQFFLIYLQLRILLHLD